ncbi:hypothetical protein SAMN05216554_3288 [Herbiconiux ginsengi]|uniref:Uncharacterized protein n=2 Tax=Herbiconiux ginsengi TaxID=381665 RepID=A0A1H3S678_9MICO|nr:hypothetical protein SAMN05216554_3288 [Herbiconiux ginsengi]
MTSGIDYTRFRAAFGEEPGILPDGEVLGTSEDDWDAVFALLRASGWKVTRRDHVSPLPPTWRELPEGESIAVWPAVGVQVNFFPGPEVVYFDIDLREFVNQAAMDALADLMKRLGDALGGDVIILHEGASGPPILRYSPTSGLFTLS